MHITIGVWNLLLEQLKKTKTTKKHTRQFTKQTQFIMYLLSDVIVVCRSVCVFFQFYRIIHLFSFFFTQNTQSQHKYSRIFFTLWANMCGIKIVRRTFENELAFLKIEGAFELDKRKSF